MPDSTTQLETVNMSRNGAAATIELNRPQALNAWNAQFGADLLAAVRELAADEAVRAVVVTGAGRGFSSGADLKDSGAGQVTDDGRVDVQARLTEVYHPIMETIREMPKPVVAAVNGPAVGIGCSLALCCDLIIAAESAYFLLAFVNIGLVPDGGSSLFLPTRVGMARSAELMMLGERLPAANAHEINSLYKIELVIALVIFVAVEGALLYALVRFRARKGAVAAQIRGNTRLEVGWTVGAALILVALAAITFAKLSSIEDPRNSGPEGLQLASASGGQLLASNHRLPPNRKALEIHVIGRQYIWQFVYPGAAEPDGLGAPYSYEEMVVPTNTTITLDIVSLDVVHSWWIPQLGGKFQAVPGYHNYTWFKVPNPGLYRGQCAVMCGRGHARMMAVVRAEP